jgi:arabinogalactan oligomer/maltooligosaccharide transport system permease protein
MSSTVPAPNAAAAAQTTTAPKAATWTGGGRRDSVLKKALIHAALFLAALIAVVPVLRVFSVALRPSDRLLERDFQIIPDGATLASFGHVLTETDFPQWVFNSLIITVGTSIVGLIFAATSAYAFSRYKFPGRGVGLTALLATQLIPATMLLVPLFILAIQLDLRDTYRGLMIAYSVTSVPFSVWILKGYYDTVPIELEEAARIDGCSLLQVLIHIVIPLARIGLVTVGILGFMAFWGEYGFASIILETQTKYTATIGLVRQMTELTTAFNTIGAAAVMMGLPLLLFLMLVQRQFVRGLAAGAVKDV